MAALDDKLTDEDLDGIIEEVDEDGSGTVDLEGNFYHKKLLKLIENCLNVIIYNFTEFMEMMTG